jgi:glucans biosynthesis protein
LRQDNLDYDKYREIRFRRDRALWTADDLPFRIEFFHPGYLYQEPVHLYEFTLTHVQPIRFVQDFFDYGKLDIANQIPSKTGYAGFRILYPLNKTNQLDELGAFLGASYFRLLGKDQRYGLSARGLALDSGESDRPEEFPIFTDWWLGKPQKEDTELRLFAILDSVSCTGAYEFLIRPGETTV